MHSAFPRACDLHIYNVYTAALQLLGSLCAQHCVFCSAQPRLLPICYNFTRKGKSVTISLNAQILHLLALYSRLSRSLVARFRFRLGVPCISLSVSLSKNATWFGWWLGCFPLSLLKQPTLLFLMQR